MATASCPDEVMGFASMLSSGAFSDLSIKCQGHSFKVHKVILAAKSVFFRKLCEGPFKDNSVVDLPDDEPAHVTRMLTFVYTGALAPESASHTKCGIELDQFADITDHLPATEDHQPSCLLFTDMFALADKYGITQLEEGMRQAFLKSWYNPGDADDLRGRPYDEKLAKRDEPIMRAVYSTTPSQQRGLRNIVVRSTKRMTDGNNDATSSPTIRKILQEVHEFCFDMAVLKFNETRPKCSKCERDNDGLVVPECRCGNINGCTKNECRDEWVQNSMCGYCDGFGTVSYPRILVP